MGPTDSFSIEAGKLPTLIGEEGTFTFQNLNIERGLLWNVENLINRGVQGNYTWGPLGFALSWNDGYYTDNFKYVTGAVTWTVDSSDTIVLAGGGPFAKYTHLNGGPYTVGGIPYYHPKPVELHLHREPDAARSLLDLYEWAVAHQSVRAVDAHAAGHR